MGKLIFAINITLDGCCDHTKGIGDEEIHEYFTNLLGEVDVLVYGRKTYELMVPFWPDIARNNSGTNETMNAFARAFDAVGKIVVFSRSLQQADDGKTKIVGTDLREEILKLKQEEGKDILLGGVDLPSQLMQMDLIDEYRFVVQPLIVGEGRRLLEGISLEGLKLKLVSSKVFKSGCMALHYVK
ncbi:dihydrofolate reductase family protein [Sediminibacterium ginsengisoli]|uniref:Dihydrofolate reductase n=1 Tax=Sediminibacterium ginsengisoli TaxID=413434 RepID=A0A1T4RRT4_9BACT|nr:dihydrofolate reductase family protein [Sediminibacterium ginsengisoli]SKA18700.1 Dihydrofolate reductase [Sediminibacterium ginsengisoli]